MQASKIVPTAVYAIKYGDGLVRFRVSKVVTTQTRTSKTSSPHDYDSVVTGTIHEKDCEPAILNLSPESILGPFDQYAELMAREMAEREAESQKRAAFEAICIELCQRLYELTGLTPPDDPDPKSYRATFRTQYSGIQIDREGIEPMLKLVRAITPASATRTAPTAPARLTQPTPGSTHP